jgi:hypothetical protein
MKRAQLYVAFILLMNFSDTFGSDQARNHGDDQPRVIHRTPERTVTAVFKEMEQRLKIERQESAKESQIEIAERVRRHNDLATQSFIGGSSDLIATDHFNEQSPLDYKINFLTEVEQNLPPFLARVEETSMFYRIQEKKGVFTFLQHVNMLTHDNDQDAFVASVAKKKKAIDNAGEDYCCCWPRYKAEDRDLYKEKLADKYIKKSQVTLDGRLQTLQSLAHAQNKNLFEITSESTLIREEDRV